MTATPLRWIRPKPGLVVRDPADAAPLPGQGKGVEWSGYWQRRLDDGDIAETDQKAVEAAERKAATVAAAAKGDAA
ncbi:MAG: DUF2635 domain-containing protein [Sphingobium sp.]